MQAAGYTRGQIAGALGNLQLESGFNPRINEGGKIGAPMGVGGFGLAQWTGGRQNALINFAKQKGLDPGTAEVQADFLVYELGGPEKRAGQSLRGAVSPEEAARRFVVDYERAGIPKTEQRQQAARAIYEKLGGLEGQSQQATSSTNVQDFLKGFLLKNLLLGSQNQNPTIGEQLLKTAVQKPVTELEADIGTAALYTPRSPFLDALTQFQLQ
jgi:hypothetical protein